MLGGEHVSIPMGTLDQRAGILPRFLHEICSTHQKEGRTYRYSCTFCEVYNESIRDLSMYGKKSSAERRKEVHVHPKYGIWVDGLHRSVVTTADQALQLVAMGNQVRAVAATTLNERSSRSHAIFSFKYESPEDANQHVESTVTFVDLAGREDQARSTCQALQFREMCYINTSLFHLSHLITKLSEDNRIRGSLADFRNSKLTMLLSQALNGNSRTLLIATLSPCRCFYEDSVSTLSFANSVKKIKTKPIVNSMAPTQQVAELEAEVKALKKQLADSKGATHDQEQELIAAQALISYYKTTFEEVSQMSEKLDGHRKVMAAKLGISENTICASSSGELIPFFTKLIDDASLQGCCNYFLTKPDMIMGHDDKQSDILIQGVGVADRMCEVSHTPQTGVVIKLIEGIETPRILVNGRALVHPETSRVIEHGQSLFLGYAHAFRLVVPTAERIESTGTLDAGAFARATVSMDMMSALAETVDESSEQFKELFPFLQQLSGRVPEATVQAFLRDLHRICPLIDEANLITKEVFGDEGLSFELHALTDVFDFENDVPELVVCVVQDPMTMQATARKSIAMSRPRQSLALVAEMGLSDHMTLGGQEALLYVWTLEKFLRRLEAIREAYQEGSDDGDNFKKLRKKIGQKPYHNPWREMAFADVKLMCEEVEEGSSTANSTPANKRISTKSSDERGERFDQLSKSNPRSALSGSTASLSQSQREQPPYSARSAPGQDSPRGLPSSRDEREHPSKRGTSPLSRTKSGDLGDDHATGVPLASKARARLPSGGSASLAAPRPSGSEQVLSADALANLNAASLSSTARLQAPSAFGAGIRSDSPDAPPWPVRHDIDELRKELMSRRLETPRLTAERDRLADLLNRFERMLEKISTDPVQRRLAKQVVDEARLEHRRAHAGLHEAQEAPISARDGYTSAASPAGGSPAGSIKAPSAGPRFTTPSSPPFALTARLRSNQRDQRISPQGRRETSPYRPMYPASPIVTKEWRYVAAPRPPIKVSVPMVPVPRESATSPPRALSPKPEGHIVQVVSTTIGASPPPATPLSMVSRTVVGAAALSPRPLQPSSRPLTPPRIDSTTAEGKASVPSVANLVQRY
eukprot:gnl/TRDRNA2_/TRDRNA2_92112_c0_seq1.p1 gnl/TRDRNA2_/TRDRNA2_92112_c0~~gnl/TRDRNA2_/TRDRNA2_92112_c0_seq1.p1  ORF type:complete len:1123 (+),score=192.17 gnl/TRDRNA2_/TRDRNA2_92112_c0_seq1:62-3370(+)